MTWRDVDTWRGHASPHGCLCGPCVNSDIEQSGLNRGIGRSGLNRAIRRLGLNRTIGRLKSQGVKSASRVTNFARFDG